MKLDKSVCPQNFQVWVAFLMGMIVIIIAIVVFNNVLVKSRVGYAPDNMRAIELDTKGVDVSINTIQTVSMDNKNEAQSAWLGIEPIDVSEDIARQLDLSISKGVLISRVIENSPAESAGLLRGDILYEFDYRDVKDTDRLSMLMSKQEPGDRVKISFFRNNQRQVLYVLLGQKDSSIDTSSIKQIAGDIIPSNQKWGFVISELMGSLRLAFDIPENVNGVIVLMVIPGSPAEKAGLIKGDLIKQINQVPIAKLSDFFEALQTSDQKLLLNIIRQGSEFYITVATTTNPLSGYAIAQEGIGMNRPIYVPGYDQTQSGEPDEKTKLLTSTLIF
nr:magnetosome protein MamE-Cter-greigite [Desulfobacteraceae bacterium]